MADNVFITCLIETRLHTLWGDRWRWSLHDMDDCDCLGFYAFLLKTASINRIIWRHGKHEEQVVSQSGVTELLSLLLQTLRQCFHHNEVQHTHTHTHTHLNLLHKFLSGYKTDLVYYWCLEMIEVNTTIRETTGWFCLFILKDSDSHGLKGRSCSVVRLYGSRAAGLWHHILRWTHKYLRMGWWPRRNASCWQCVKLSWTNKLLVSLLSTGGARIQRKESWF